MPAIIDILKAIDSLLAEKDYSIEVCEELISFASTEPTACKYLFGNISEANYLKNLCRLDVFNFSEGDVGCLNAKAGYLCRIADRMPTEVLDIMLSADNIDSRLLSKFTDAACRMPREGSEKWAQHLADIIATRDRQTNSALLFSVEPFIQRLAELQSNVTFELLSVCLDVQGPEEGDTDKFALSIPHHHYLEILENAVPEAGLFDATKMANLLADKLDRAMELKGRGANPKKDFKCTFWLPAVEDSRQNRDYYIEGAIAIALRRVIEESIKAGTALKEWLDWLGAREWLIYRRMALHLVRIYGSDEAKVEWILKKDLFDDTVSLHEYLLLLKDAFGELGSEEKEAFLCWIDKLPLPEGEMDEDRRQKRRKWQQYVRLRFIEEHLDSDWQKRLDLLRPAEDEHDLERLSFPFWTGSVKTVVDKSPIPREQVAQMPVEELVKYLLEASPEDDFNNITESGLANAVTAAVAGNPVKYIMEIHLLKNPEIKPIYIRGVTVGLVEQAPEPIDDDVLLDWIQWCMELPERHSKQEAPEPGHGDNKRRLLRYLQNRIKPDSEDLLLIKYREKVFSIIQDAMRDPDPRSDGNWKDYHFQAINTVRGAGLDVAFTYALWVLDDVYKNTHRKDSLSEFWALLEHHLNPEIEPTPVIRSCYGLHIPQLCWMNKEWMVDNLTSIFPEDADHEGFFEAAWESYLLYCACHKIVYDVLKPVYERAITLPDIKRTDFGDDNTRKRDAIVRLCSHYALFYAWEQIDLDEEGMLCRFVRNAAPEYQTEVLSFMGATLDENEELPQQVRARFQKFHEWWEKEIAPQSPKGWEAFGVWFKQKYLDREWKLERLIIATRHTTFKFLNEDVISTLLRDYFDDFTLKVMEAVDNYIHAILESDEKWDLKCRGSLPELLSKGHHHLNPVVKNKADELLGELVSAGFLKYRDIYEDKNDST